MSGGSDGSLIPTVELMLHQHQHFWSYCMCLFLATLLIIGISNCSGISVTVRSHL